MESTNHSLRILTPDHEDLVNWPDGVSQPSIFEVLRYIKFQIKKKHSTESLSFVDMENTQHTIENVLDFELSPVFVLFPTKNNSQTDLSVEPRMSKHVYNFKDENTVRIQKFENLKKTEEVEMRISVIKTLNEANKKRNFEIEGDEAMAQYKKQALANRGKNEAINNPVNFVSEVPAFQKEEKMLTPEDLANDDMSKREKVHGNDGKSQWSFINIFKKKEEPQQRNINTPYTIEDVKKHNRKEDAWMIVNNKVYDVTHYIPFHPGGVKILAGVGRDGTELFNKYHPWVNAEFLLAKYQVGFLTKNSK